MARTIPTRGNNEWFQRYLKALIGKLLHETPDAQKETIFNEARNLQGAFNTLGQLERLSRFSNIPEQSILPNDESAHMEYNPSWMDIAFENIVSNFGRYGIETVSSIEEAVCYSYTMTKIFGSKKIYFRGEHKYGYMLQSRAERHMTEDEKRSQSMAA